MTEDEVRAEREELEKKIIRLGEKLAVALTERDRMLGANRMIGFQIEDIL